MNFELSGKIIEKYDTVQISDSFKKREFVIEVENERNSNWNDFVKFQITQDKCSLLDPIQPNDVIKVSFNIRGRKWEKEGKVQYFSNLEAWRIESAAPSQSNQETPPPSAEDMPPEAENDGNDLPF